MIDCSEAGERLDDHLDGALDPGAAAAIERHLATCEACQAEAEGLRALIAGARLLPRERPPARDLWPAIVGRIAFLRHRSVRRGVLLAAATALLLVVGALGSRALFAPRAVTVAVAPVARPGDLGAPLAEERQYVDAVTRLRAALDRRRSELSPEVVQVVERNLAIIDSALREIRQALRDDPGNVLLEQILSSTNQQKVELFEQVLALVDRR
jgi:anti-sigma factor RsiW